MTSFILSENPAVDFWNRPGAGSKNLKPILFSAWSPTRDSGGVKGVMISMEVIGTIILARVKRVMILEEGSQGIIILVRRGG